MIKKNRPLRSWISLVYTQHNLFNMKKNKNHVKYKGTKQEAEDFRNNVVGNYAGNYTEIIHGLINNVGPRDILDILGILKILAILDILEHSINSIFSIILTS